MTRPNVSRAGQKPSAPLPISADAIDATWLTTALATSYPGVVVTDLEQVGTLTGTGTKVLVECRYNDAGAAAGLPTRLCVKGGFAAHRQEMVFLYQNEARFFGEIAPLLDMRVPRCFFSGRDDHQGIVVMEDLVAAGATICKVQTTLDYRQAVAFLDSLAALHARWWNDPALDDPRQLGWLVRQDPLPDDHWGAYGRSRLHPDLWAHCIGLPRGLAIPRVFHDRVTMHEALQALRRHAPNGPTCLLHSDVHLGNLYIDADGTPGFLDWQSPRKGHWAHDLTYFLMSALDPLDRRASERDLVRGYLAALAARGVQSVPSEAQAWRSIRAHIVYGLFYWLVNPVEWQAEVNNTAVVPRFAWAAVDHHAPPLPSRDRRAA